MERLKNMELKKSFFILSVSCMVISLLLVFAVYAICQNIRSEYPVYGIIIDMDGVETRWEKPSAEQEKAELVLSIIQLVSCIAIPACGLWTAGILFYRIKLKEPLCILQTGAERIQKNDLDFHIPKISEDELGRTCMAFETMRAELLKANQELWQQAEERRRLNAAFSHDLRNPVMVLKGTVKLLRQGICDSQTIDRLEAYTLRIELYIEAMSGIQKLEQMPVQKRKQNCSLLKDELADTAKLLAPCLSWSVSAPEEEIVELDHGIFLTVAENLISNAARFAREKLTICLTLRDSFLFLSVTDDGCGYSEKLLKEGPKPFGKEKEDSEHFGMGLYSSKILCQKHGGTLHLTNKNGHGAQATAVFLIN